MVTESIIGCAIVLGHEFGHLLGENDEYYELEDPVNGGKRQDPPNHNVAKNENVVRAYFRVGPRRTYHGTGPIPARD